MLRFNIFLLVNQLLITLPLFQFPLFPPAPPDLGLDPAVRGLISFACIMPEILLLSRSC